MVKSYETVQPVPFGSYQLVERLAMGGMAEVYLARPDGQQRFVALKRILPNIAADDEFIAMFIDEAKIAGQLNHPNVAQIFDLGKINSSYFIAMEYVSGHDLRALWDRTRDAEGGKSAMPIGLACYIVKKICDGLDYAHRRRDAKGRPLGIIHRDVSPQNILVSYDGDLKIIDFGIAKAANRIVKTQTGILKGKFAYMAPEQARGEPTDHRADIFAIGVILYEMLTGERTFKADSDFALLEKVRRVDMPAPRSLRSEIPKDLERIIYKALAKEAGDRYAWASALGSDLDRFMSDQGYASSKEELGAFLQRTFREEFKEEQRRLAGYHALFDDDEPSSTQMRGGRPASASEESESSSADGTAQGDSVRGESDVATSFEDGGPTAATQQLDAAKKKNGVPDTAQIVELRDKAARIAQQQAAQQSQQSQSQSSLMASMPDNASEDDEIDDDDIDASAEASAMGAAVGGAPDFHETSPKNGTARRGSNSNSRRPRMDETQIDPDAPSMAQLKNPPVAVARDEMPKKLRVVSANANGNNNSARTSLPGNANAQPPPIPQSTVPQQSPSSSMGAMSSSSLMAPPPDERSGQRERSQLSRAAMPAAAARPRTATGPIIVAALLGAIIGAGVVGIVWLASQQPTSTVMFVATPRQTEVRLGDEVLCTQTPCAVLLELGKHEVRFKAPGAEQLSRTVEVKSEGTAPVEVVLERTRNDVRLETVPPGATVVLDDKPLPQATPMTLPPLVVGTVVRLKITHEGFEPFEVSRAVDDEAAWRYDLPSSFTQWTLSAEPADALIDGPGKDVGAKLVVTAGTKKATVVKLSRPGCQNKTISLLASGKPEAEQKVILDCKNIDAGLFIQAPKRTQVTIDGIDLPRTAKLDPYPLPAGTWNIRLRSQRGKTELQTVELRSHENLTLTSKLK